MEQRFFTKHFLRAKSFWILWYNLKTEIPEILKVFHGIWKKLWGKEAPSHSTFHQLVDPNLKIFNSNPLKPPKPIFSSWGFLWPKWLKKSNFFGFWVWTQVFETEKCLILSTFLFLFNITDWKYQDGCDINISCWPN